MFQNNNLICKVCGAYCSQQDWDRSRSCTSCHNFYQRSTLAMNRYLFKRKKQGKTVLFSCLCVSDLDNYSFHFQIKTFFIPLYLYRKLRCQRRSDVQLEIRKTKSLQALSIRQISIYIDGIEENDGF